MFGPAPRRIVLIPHVADAFGQFAGATLLPFDLRMELRQRLRRPYPSIGALQEAGLPFLQPSVEVTQFGRLLGVQAGVDGFGHLLDLLAEAVLGGFEPLVSLVPGDDAGQGVEGVLVAARGHEHLVAGLTAGQGHIGVGTGRALGGVEDRVPARDALGAVGGARVAELHGLGHVFGGEPVGAFPVPDEHPRPFVDPEHGERLPVRHAYMVVVPAGHDDVAHMDLLAVDHGGATLVAQLAGVEPQPLDRPVDLGGLPVRDGADRGVRVLHPRGGYRVHGRLVAVPMPDHAAIEQFAGQPFGVGGRPFAQTDGVGRVVGVLEPVHVAHGHHVARVPFGQLHDAAAAHGIQLHGVAHQRQSRPGLVGHAQQRKRLVLVHHAGLVHDQERVTVQPVLVGHAPVGVAAMVGLPLGHAIPGVFGIGLVVPPAVCLQQTHQGPRPGADLLAHDQRRLLGRRGDDQPFAVLPAIVVDRVEHVGLARAGRALDHGEGIALADRFDGLALSGVQRVPFREIVQTRVRGLLDAAGGQTALELVLALDHGPARQRLHPTGPRPRVLAQHDAQFPGPVAYPLGQGLQLVARSRRPGQAHLVVGGDLQLFQAPRAVHLAQRGDGRHGAPPHRVGTEPDGPWPRIRRRAGKHGGDVVASGAQLLVPRPVVHARVPPPLGLPRVGPCLEAQTHQGPLVGLRHRPVADHAHDIAGPRITHPAHAVRMRGPPLVHQLGHTRIDRVPAFAEHVRSIPKLRHTPLHVQRHAVRGHRVAQAGVPVHRGLVHGTDVLVHAEQSAAVDAVPFIADPHPVDQLQVAVQLGVAGTAGEMGRGHEHHLVRPHPPPPAVPAAQTHRQPFGQEPPDRLLATRLGLHAGLAHVPVHDRRHVQILTVVQRDLIGAHVPRTERLQQLPAVRVAPVQQHLQTAVTQPLRGTFRAIRVTMEAQTVRMLAKVRFEALSGLIAAFQVLLQGTPPGGDLDDMPTHDTNSTPLSRWIPACPRSGHKYFAID